MATTKQHTEGPWSVVNTPGEAIEVLGPSGGMSHEICTILTHDPESGTPWPRIEGDDLANAVLIASAPAMLDALHMVGRFLAAQGVDPRTPAYVALNAAIAQAEGGAPIPPKPKKRKPGRPGERGDA